MKKFTLLLFGCYMVFASRVSSAQALPVPCDGTKYIISNEGFSGGLYSIGINQTTGWLSYELKGIISISPGSLAYSAPMQRLILTGRSGNHLYAMSPNGDGSNTWGYDDLFAVNGLYNPSVGAGSYWTGSYCTEAGILYVFYYDQATKTAGYQTINTAARPFVATPKVVLQTSKPVNDAVMLNGTMFAAQDTIGLVKINLTIGAVINYGTNFPGHVFESIYNDNGIIKIFGEDHTTNGGPGQMWKADMLTGNLTTTDGIPHNGYQGLSDGASCNAVSITYTFSGSGDWSNAANWNNNTVPPNPLPAGSHIIIDPIADQECILNNNITLLPGATLIVQPGKKFTIKVM